MSSGKSTHLTELLQSSFCDACLPEHQLGPDYIVPTSDKKTWLANGAVKLNLDVSGNDEKPISTVTFLKRTVEKAPNQVALAVKRDEIWVKWTYMDYWKEVCAAAKGLIKLGLQPFHGVGILGFNAPEWFFTHFAAMFSGGFAAGIYSTNSPEACFYILKDCAANVVVVENDLQLQKILQIKDKLPDLKAIIQYTGTPTHPDVYSWDDLLLIGKTLSDEDLNRRIRGIAINQCCCLIYTSGTTGNAKGVMLTHDNLTYFITYFAQKLFPLEWCKEVYASYLPLSHIAALEADVYGPIACAATVCFATPDALKGKLVDVLTEVQPTAMIGVPRVFEKMFEKIKETEDGMSKGKKNILSWAQKQALAYNLKKYNNSNVTPNLGYTLAKKIVLSKIKKLLGFNRARCLVIGGAPMAKEVLKFFLGLDIFLYESYGLSESSGPHFANVRNDSRFGSVGRAPPVQRTKIMSIDGSKNGEILLQGRTICMGYLNMESTTSEAIDDEGWLHTGDIGYLDRDQFLFITGRIKELLITAGGENVAPAAIEESIKNMLSIVSNCMLVGDKKKYLTMLITLKTEINLDTMLPTDQLAPAAVKWCRDRGCEYTWLTELLSAGPDDRIMQGIQEGIDTYNKKLAVSNAQRIQKWIILSRDFSLGGEELGPTMKLKRPVVMKKYSAVIEEMYKE